MLVLHTFNKETSAEDVSSRDTVSLFEIFSIFTDQEVGGLTSCLPCPFPPYPALRAFLVLARLQQQPRM